MITFIVGSFCLVLGFIWGAVGYNNTEGKKAENGLYTIFNGKCYKYVEVKKED